LIDILYSSLLEQRDIDRQRFRVDVRRLWIPVTAELPTAQPGLIADLDQTAILKHEENRMPAAQMSRRYTAGKIQGEYNRESVETAFVLSQV
jgi:hypothetical protein